MRKLATAGGVVLLVVFVLLSLVRCGGGSVCVCPLGYVCVTVEKTRSWRCEPSPMSPTWLSGDGVEEASTK